MKRILIVNNNLEIGGIQKSLINLLNAISGRYDITLLLFSKTGPLLEEVPDDIKIITPKKTYRVYGLPKNKLKRHPFLFLFKFFLLLLNKLFPTKLSRTIIGFGQKKLSGFDAVVSFTHPFGSKSLNAGCAEFVLEKTISNNKICFVHCDYLHSGTRNKQNDMVYRSFDKIICCSESVKNVFLSCLPELGKKTFAFRNCVDTNIATKSNCFDPHFLEEFVNIVIVSRLSEEKGHAIAISSLQASKRKDIKLYFVGSGPLFASLTDMVEKAGLSENVFFAGEQPNPYPFIKNADYLLVASIHEAAPIVFDEAKRLGTRIITSNTTSAEEMVSGFGIIYHETEDLVHIFETLRKKQPEEKVILDSAFDASKFDSLLF